MKEKIRRFMVGRYGTDQLGRFTMAVGIVSLLLFMLTRFRFFDALTWVCLIMYYFRAFSRNTGKRYEENLQFLNLKNRLTARFHISKTELSQRKYYRFYNCPTCKQKVRVPKGRGKIAITCPRCRTEFVRKS